MQLGASRTNAYRAVPGHWEGNLTFGGTGSHYDIPMVSGTSSRTGFRRLHLPFPGRQNTFQLTHHQIEGVRQNADDDDAHDDDIRSEKV